MLGWLRFTATFASSSNICRNCGASASDGWIFLMTRILERPCAKGSRARNTSAMPPEPRRRRIWYLPKASMHAEGTVSVPWRPSRLMTDPRGENLKRLLAQRGWRPARADVDGLFAALEEVDRETATLVERALARLGNEILPEVERRLG